MSKTKTKKLSRLQQHLQREKQLLSELKAVQHNIKQIRNSNGLKVSEHATLRFMERVQKLDVTEIHSKIVTPYLLQLHNQLGDGTLPNGEGLQVVIKDAVVVTVIS